MLFNSITFFIFLPIVFILYWFVFDRSLRARHLLIIAASYVFYGWWDWRFLILISFSTGVDYLSGIWMLYLDKNKIRFINRKKILFLSIFINLGILSIFKYYNFFIENFIAAFGLVGYSLDFQLVKIILPVGISFYTFQSLSYSIDVYKRKLEPTQDFWSFCAYVCYFPQLVAGPIERATHLLPQFQRMAVFDREKAVDGLRQALWGFFKKVVIADNCATYVAIIFDNQTQHAGSTLFLGAILFSFQIYGDFSGYSDIAIGVSRLFGIELMRNFNFPYFSRDVAEFWRKWHISLTTWFKDYVYLPLGGSRASKGLAVRNTLIVFLLSGFWHGANWTFIFWGALNACYFLPLLLLNQNRRNFGIAAAGRLLPTLRESLAMGMTFCLITLSWVLFRAASLGSAIAYYNGIFSASFFSFPHVYCGSQYDQAILPVVIGFVLFLVAIEWVGRGQQFAIETIGRSWPVALRWGWYYGIIALIMLFAGRDQLFIYFQF